MKRSPPGFGRGPHGGPVLVRRRDAVTAPNIETVFLDMLDCWIGISQGALSVWLTAGARRFRPLGALRDVDRSDRSAINWRRPRRMCWSWWASHALAEDQGGF